MSRWSWLFIAAMCACTITTGALVDAVWKSDMRLVWAVLVSATVVSASLDGLVKAVQWIERRERQR